MSSHSIKNSSRDVFEVDVGGGNRENNLLDDDGRAKRTGTVITATAHIITAVIGSGVLSLAWAIAQLGWVIGPIVLIAFSFITYYTSTFLADCYRTPDPITGKRNYTYMDAVRATLGGRNVQLCGLAQYANIIGVTIGYVITASISMVAVERSNCFHKHGHEAACHVSNYPFMVLFACIQIVLSQIPNFHKLSLLSILAAVMSFAYSGIGVGLSITRVASGESRNVQTSIEGTTVGQDVTASQKPWRMFQALGNIAFAYAFSTVLVEIQDTLKSSPPENKVMRKASFFGISATTLFYALCGCVGYAAFGNDAPGNFLTGFGFYEPFWLIDIGNICIAVHLIGAYQVFAQPFFGFIELWSAKRWPQSEFITREIPLYGGYTVNLFRLVWRTTYVIVTVVAAMIFPFFNDILGLIGAISFWPLTVFFPVEMYIARTDTKKYSAKWIALRVMSLGCLVVSILVAAGSVQGLVQDVRKPFRSP